MMPTEQNGCGVPRSHLLPAFFCLILFSGQTILMILNHFCETCVLFLPVYDQRRK